MQIAGSGRLPLPCCIARCTSLKVARRPFAPVCSPAVSGRPPRSLRGSLGPISPPREPCSGKLNLGVSETWSIGYTVASGVYGHYIIYARVSIVSPKTSPKLELDGNILVSRRTYVRNEWTLHFWIIYITVRILYRRRVRLSSVMTICRFKSSGVRKNDYFLEKDRKIS